MQEAVAVLSETEKLLYKIIDKDYMINERHIMKRAEAKHR